MADTQISIAMATFNGASHIREQLQSLSNQTKLPAELIITDDGSTDETLEIIHEFSATAPFDVRVQKNPHRIGYRANFIRAASSCAGELIAFCDQDDIWLPEKLAKSSSAFSDPSVLFCYHNARILSSDGELLGNMAELALPKNINPPFSFDPWMHGPGFTQMFRKSLLRFDGFWDHSIDELNTSERMAHDQWIPFLGSTLGSTAYINENLAFYRQHGSNIYGWHTKEPIGLRIVRALLPDRSRYERFQLAAKNRSLILKDIAESVDGDWKENALIGAKIFSIIERHYKARREIYSDKSILKRSSSFKFLYMDNGYSNQNPWSFGRKSLYKDSAIGLLWGKMIATHLSSRLPFKE